MFKKSLLWWLASIIIIIVINRRTVWFSGVFELWSSYVGLIWKNWRFPSGLKWTQGLLKLANKEIKEVTLFLMHLIVISPHAPKVTRIIIFMPYVFTAFYSLYIPFIALVYFKHLNRKQKRSECGRTLFTFHIDQNGSRLLSRNKKHQDLAFLPQEVLTLQRNREKTTKKNRAQEERSTQLWLTASCGGCMVGIHPF